MIPPADESGYLPPGIHRATLDEIQARFGELSELRRVQMESVRWMVELAVRRRAERIVLNGSFVTDIMESNDVDCVLLLRPGGRKDPSAIRELREGLPFLDIAIVREGIRGVSNPPLRHRSPRRAEGNDRGGDLMLQNQSELAKTREKLRLLEASYEEARLENSGDEELREAEIESLARFIKQLKDKIAHYESRQPAPG